MCLNHFISNNFVLITIFVPEKVNLNSVLSYRTSRNGKQSARSKGDLNCKIAVTSLASLQCCNWFTTTPWSTLLLGLWPCAPMLSTKCAVRVLQTILQLSLNIPRSARNVKPFFKIHETCLHGDLLLNCRKCFFFVERDFFFVNLTI